MEYWKQELYHHGILGQKWGKKNGPPYPLAPNKHSASERKVGWKKSLNKSSNKQNLENIPEGGAGGGVSDEDDKILEQFYDDLDDVIENTGTSGYELILSDNFSTLLGEAGIDVDKLSKEQITRLREKAIQHYRGNTTKTYKNRPRARQHNVTGKMKEGALTKRGKVEHVPDWLKEKNEESWVAHSSLYHHGILGMEETAVKEIVKNKKKEIKMENWKQELYHHGILGMKWGKRNGPPYPLNKSDYSALEKAAIKKEYKRRKKAGETVPFKRYRNSTGENYNSVEKEYSTKLETITKDPEYRKLSKAAFDAERKRLMSEKKYLSNKSVKVGPVTVQDISSYDRYINSKDYQKLVKASEEATRKKEEYAEKRQAQIKSEYVDKFKDAKLDDLEIFDKESRDNAKQWIDTNISTIYVYDDNLDFNIDNFYEDWVEKEKFK